MPKEEEALAGPVDLVFVLPIEALVQVSPVQAVDSKISFSAIIYKLFPSVICPNIVHQKSIDLLQELANHVTSWDIITG